MRNLSLVVLSAMVFSSLNAFASGDCKKQFAECTAPATANVKICKQQRKDCWKSRKNGEPATPPTDAEMTPPAVK